MGATFTLIGLMLAAATPSAEPVTGTPAPPIDEVTQTEDVAMKSDGYERMTVPVRLSGSGPYRFLVDTGADRTAISRALADQLQLQRGKSVRLHSVAGVSDVDTATLPSLQITSTPIRVASAPVLSQSHIGADGILGVDSLQAQRILFDFKANTMSVVPSVKQPLPEDRDPETIVITARQKHGRLIVTHARADNNPVRVVLDTGSQVTIGNEALRRKLARSGRGGADRLGKIQLRAVTGELLTGEYVILDRLEIGGATLSNLAVVFADAHTFRRLGMEKRPALLLGMNAMRAFERVSIDFANKKLRLLPPQLGSADSVRLAAARF